MGAMEAEEQLVGVADRSGGPRPAADRDAAAPLGVPGGRSGAGAEDRRTPRVQGAPSGPGGRVDGWFFAVWVTVTALYSLTLTMRFGLYDDYRNAGADDLLRFDVGDGRPLAALVHAFQFHHADRFSEFVWIRGVTVVLLGLAAACLSHLLRGVGLRPLAAAALSVCAAATVSTQIIAAWGVTLIVAPVAMLLGAGGGLVSWRATASLTAGRSERSAGLRRAGAGGALLVAALCFYQPAAMAFWLSILILQATDVLGAGRRLAQTLWLGVISAAAMAVYLVIWKTGAALTNRSGARGELSSDPSEKLQWFWDVALRRAFHPFSLSGTSGGALALAAAVVGIGGVVVRQRRSGASAPLAALACAGCFPLAYLPNLATSESWASSRSLAVLMPMAVVLVGLGAHGLVRSVDRRPAPPARHLARTGPSRPPAESLFAGLLAVAAAVVALRAATNVQRYLVVSNAVELAAFEDAVREAAAGQPDEIILVPSEWVDTIAPGVSFDEFGYPATAAAWALEPMARSAVRPVEYAGTFRVINRSDLASVPSGSVVVDAKVVLAEIDH